MWRALLTTFTLLAILGCDGAADGLLVESSDAEQPAEVPENVQTFLDDFQKAVAARDWEKLHSLHWSETKHTPEELEQTYSGLLEKVGEVSAAEYGHGNFYDQNSFEKYIDEEEIPGPKELLRGDVEFFLSPGEPDARKILVWTYLCEEEGTIKVFDYIEVTLE